MPCLPNVALIPRPPDFGDLEKMYAEEARKDFLRQNPDVFYGDRKKKGLMTNLIFYASDTEGWKERICSEWRHFTVRKLDNGRQFNFTKANGPKEDKIVNINFHETGMILVQGTEANLLEFYNTFENEDRRRTAMKQAKGRQEDDTSE